MGILKFDAFLESYLGSGRHLLYHTSYSSTRLDSILSGDILKVGKNARGPVGVCFSRSINWTNDLNNDFRFVLDSDLMIRKGYRAYPLQELMYRKDKGWEVNKDASLYRNVWKGNMNWYKKGQRQAPHNIDSLPKERLMEIEFEERVLREIIGLGRFVIYIDIVSENHLKSDILKEYLIKYPHIKVRLMNRKLSHITKEIDREEILTVVKKVLH